MGPSAYGDIPLARPQQGDNVKSQLMQGVSGIHLSFGFDYRGWLLSGGLRIQPRRQRLVVIIQVPSQSSNKGGLEPMVFALPRVEVIR
jgi:hypothetical protein